MNHQLTQRHTGYCRMHYFFLNIFSQCRSLTDHTASCPRSLSEWMSSDSQWNAVLAAPSASILCLAYSDCWQQLPRFVDSDQLLDALSLHQEASILSTVRDNLLDGVEHSHNCVLLQVLGRMLLATGQIADQVPHGITPWCFKYASITFPFLANITIQSIRVNTHRISKSNKLWKYVFLGNVHRYVLYACIMIFRMKLFVIRYSITQMYKRMSRKKVPVLWNIVDA